MIQHNSVIVIKKRLLEGIIIVNIKSGLKKSKNAINLNSCFAQNVLECST